MPLIIKKAKKMVVFSCLIAASNGTELPQATEISNGWLVLNGEQVFLKIGKPLRNFSNAEECQQLARDLDTLKEKGYNALSLNCYWHHFDHQGNGRIDVSLEPLGSLIEAIHSKGMFPCLSVETYGVGGGQIPTEFWTTHPEAVAIDFNGKPVKDDDYGFNTIVPSLFHQGYLEASRRFISELTRGVPHSKILYFETTVEPQFMGGHDIGYSTSAKRAYQPWLHHQKLEEPAWPESFPMPWSFRKNPVWLRFRAESLADWVNKDAQAFRSVAGDKARIPVDYLETCGHEMHRHNGNSIQFLTALTGADIIQVNWSWHLGRRRPNSCAYANVEKVMKEMKRAWAVSEHMTLNGQDFRPSEVNDILNNALDRGTGFGFEFVNVKNSTNDHFYAAGAAPPNIVLIYAVDLGYGDVSCFNPGRGKIPTPHIDKIAAQGMKFTDGHSSSGVCSPSRYTLLTGRYHWRGRLQKGIVGMWTPPAIAPDRMTIGSLAKKNGYRTACIGKWHLGWDWPIPKGKRALMAGSKQMDIPATKDQKAFWKMLFSQPIPSGPTARGFDLYFGTDVPNWPPFCFIENDRTVGIPSEYLPVRLLQNNQASNQGPALPVWKLEPILPAIGDRAAAYITESAKKPEPFLLYFSLTSPHKPLSVNEEWVGKSGLGPYGDFVMETDAFVGRVLAAIEESGAAVNTLVIFTSDNGCAHYIGKKELEAKGQLPGSPLRGAKADAWEGGHRVPFIVRWPGVVEAGAVNDHLVHQADLMRTFADIAGAELPDNAGEDSFSLLPLLKGGKDPIRKTAVSNSIGDIPAVRDGHWKHIAAFSQYPGKELMDHSIATLTLWVAAASTPDTPQQNDMKVVLPH